MPLPEPIVDRDPGDETVYDGGCLCVFCKNEAALPDDDLCESCASEVYGEWLLANVEDAA